MGNPKQKWTSEEEEALRAGDKWRNMTVSAGSQSVKDKSRTTKVKSNSDAAAAAPLPNPQTSAAAAADVAIDDYSEAAADSKTAPKVMSCHSSYESYNAMIFEAISAYNEPNGADTSSIISYIEKRQELPQNFRRQLSSKLRRLVAQEKLEKVSDLDLSSGTSLLMVQNSYKIKKVSSFGTKTPTPKKEVRPKPVPEAGDTVEGAANDAAYSVAEAENKSFVATEAVKESERVSKMAEDADSLLQLANEILEKCNASLHLFSLLFHFLLIHALYLDLTGLRGEIVIMG
ncbi:hypothetical protein DKX38_009864 [Salix brachista]|uniref:H15 domain-containing protein n=1 Tax=Salix brachista TaxID=2182728 RepID=A0A5N5ME36_9ROSI|nr:hypothetical protein DKX38_009864 [Salix brachista]